MTTTLLNQDREEQAAVERCLESLRRTTGLPLAFAGRPARTDDRLRLDQFSGEVLGPLRGVVVGYGTGVGGAAATTRRPLVVNEYVRAERISHHYDHVITAERLRGVFAVPVLVGQSLRTVIYGATREGQPLGERVLRSAVDLGRDLGQRLAVQDALARQRAELGAVAAAVGPGQGQEAVKQEVVREAFARLRALASQCEDPTLSGELARVAASLAGADRSNPVAQQVRVTARELDVLACVSQGMSNQEIARRLGLSAETVKSYLRSAMRRLHAGSRLEAVVLARRAGLLP